MRQTHQRIRNRLADIFLGAFRDGEKRQAIFALGAYCDLSSSRGSAIIPLFDLMLALAQLHPGTGNKEESALALLNAAGLLRVRRDEDTGGEHVADVEPFPEVSEALPVLCERVRRYREVVERAVAIGTTGHTDRVDRTLGEAALCFNAGLFFEAHEHLEHVWVSLPRGPLRQILQGIIQVSVGFHHAEWGRYGGAVNQLTKGLAKLGDGADVAVAIDLTEFVRDVRAARQRIVARGREEMQPISRAEVPRMRLRR